MRVQYCTAIHPYRQEIDSLTQMPGMFTALLGTVLKQNFTRSYVLVYSFSFPDFSEMYKYNWYKLP